MRNQPRTYLFWICLMFFLLIPFAVARGDSPSIDLTLAEVVPVSRGLNAVDWQAIEAYLPQLSMPLQQAYLLPTEPPLNISKEFGWSIDVDGDTAIVGAPPEGIQIDGGDGAAYVFVRGANGWALQAKLRASSPDPHEQLGYRVAISGDTAVVTNRQYYEEPNANLIYIFQRTGTSWSEQANFHVFDEPMEYYINSIDIDGDTVIVGVPFINGAGEAYVYTRNGTSWNKTTTFLPSNSDPIDFFGSSVAIAGNRAVVGAEDGTGEGDLWDDGSAYVFVRNENTWALEEILKLPTPIRHSGFGRSVDISGDTVIVGAPMDGVDWFNPGAYVFFREGSNWSLQAILDSPNNESYDGFGQDVAIDGDNALVGAPWDDGDGTNEENYAGAAVVFSRINGNWIKQDYLKASNPGDYDAFGYAVGLSGDIVIIGAPYRNSDSPGYEDVGAAYAFTLNKQSATLNPIADSFTSSANPSVNYGTANVIGIKKSSSANLNGFLQFDADSVPCGQLESATLNLYNTDPGTNAGSIYPVGNGWTEIGITWNNAPAISGSPLDSPGPAVINNWVAFDVTDGVTLGETFSLGLKGNIKDSVSYSSREGSHPPRLFLVYSLPPAGPPVANFSAVPQSGIEPLTVDFLSIATGCVESYAWDFGDGGSSTEADPTHIYDVPGTYTVSLTVTNDEGSDEEIKTGYITVQPAPPEIGMFLISSSKSTTIGGIPSTSADILGYNKTANAWTMVYDGSVRGTAKNVGAFELLDDGSLLLVFSANQSITGLGMATPYDVIRFTPETPNVFPLGPGTYSWFFQGKSKGLTKSSEKIDALDLDGDRLLLSVTGAASVPLWPTGVLKAADEDVFVYNVTLGQWESELLIDGSKINGMSSEDINGLWDDPSSDDYYVTILGAFNLGGGVSGKDKSIIRLTPNGGSTVFTPSLVSWLAPGATFTAKLDGLTIAP